MNLIQLIEHQVMEESPYIEELASRDKYVTEVINNWSNEQLLHRITDALKYLPFLTIP